MVNYITFMGYPNSSVETINASQISSAFLTAIKTVDVVINKSSNIIVKTMSKSCVALIEEYLSSTVNKYYDGYMINDVTLDSETRLVDNTSFDILLDEILDVIFLQLSKFGKNDNVIINVGMKRDIEYPDWEEFVITIKLPMTILNYDIYFDLWSKIGESVKERISLTEIQDENIIKKYGNPIILLENPEK